MTTLHTRPRDWFKPDPKQPRTSNNAEGLERLGDDILARGVLVPLLAKPDGSIVDGWRRWLAAGKKGITELPVIITDKPENEIKGIQLATVFHRADLTGQEKFTACAELMAMNPKWQLKDLAEFLHLSPATITKLLSVSKCSAAWQQALAAGRVSIGDCYAASSLSEAEQATLLTRRLSGASRDDIVRASRKIRKGATPSVKLSRVKLMLPSSGVCIVVSGAGLSLDGLCDALGHAQKVAKAALAQDQDIKSFQAVMTAKNKKRGAS